jgi:hypothetical protein
MRPHPRTRKTIKWAGTAATLLLLAAWVASGRWHARGYLANGYSVDLYKGCVLIELDNRPAERDVGSRLGRYTRTEPHYLWSWSSLFASYPQGLLITIPLWLPTLPLLLTTAAAWRLDTRARRRIRAGARPCPSCTYDLTGLPTPAPCPECGATTTDAATSPPQRGAGE